MSSMQSAPATIPATSAGTFTAALAPADPGTVTVAATNSGSWQDSASDITAVSPAHDTRFGSSNFTDSRENACNPCTYRMTP